MTLKEWRASQRSKGLCIECTEPAVLNAFGKLGVFCQKHREINRNKNRPAMSPKSKLVCTLDNYMDRAPVRLAYVAGLVDGEGHIGFGQTAKRYFMRPAIAIGMTDREPVAFCAELFGGRVSESRTEGGAIVYGWCATGSRACAVARAILPYLRLVRKREAALFTVRMYPFLGVCRFRITPDTKAVAGRVELENEFKEWHGRNRTTRAQAKADYYKPATTTLQ